VDEEKEMFGVGEVALLVCIESSGLMFQNRKSPPLRLNLKFTFCAQSDILVLLAEVEVWIQLRP
jgi:hypothetical protein